MPVILNEIQLFTSANTVGGILNLGGAITATRLLSQSVAGLTIPGVTIDDAAMNAETAGTLTYTPASQTITWKAPGDGQTGAAVNISADGQYHVRGFSTTAGYLLITVVAASLPIVLSTDTLTLTTRTNALCEDFSKAEALAGHTDYHCFYVKNTHAIDSITSLKMWINSDTPGADTLALGLAPVPALASSIASQTTAPASVAFSSPIAEAAGLELGPIAAGGVYAVWLRRVLPAATTARIARDISAIRFLALV